jgi:hypothetical protein
MKEITMPVLRVQGLRIVNGSLDGNGMLMHTQRAEFDVEMPSFVVMPFITGRNQHEFWVKSCYSRPDRRISTYISGRITSRP